MEDLWPEMKQVGQELKSPIATLGEQGTILGRKTKNIVIGEVKKKDHILSKQDFGYTFYISCPALNYSYALFDIYFDVDIYPLRLGMDDELRKSIGANTPNIPEILEGGIQINNEVEFKDFLKKIFNSEKTQKIISSLISLAETGG